jgi:hypothetical protein
MTNPRKLRAVRSGNSSNSVASSPTPRGPKVGWEFVTWTGKAARCNVASCKKEIHAGHVRVDHPRPRDGDPVLCVNCYGLIMAGVDPDPGAETPEWELEKREERLRGIGE